MVDEAAKALATALKNSPEFKQYAKLKEIAFRKDSTRSLYAQYKRLMVQAQACEVSGRKNEELLSQLNTLAEVLQFDTEAAAFLLAEFRLNAMLGRIYKLLAEAVGADLSVLGE
ncbi:MAG TPA: YlbF family regulator [Clostridia bacterium]|nr:YlbF family regulator [Clostridia bacterium]